MTLRRGAAAFARGAVKFARFAQLAQLAREAGMETKPEFRVVAWKDLHDVETLFVVVAQDGYRHGIYPSEHEAIAAAAKATAADITEAADPSFTLEAT